MNTADEVSEEIKTRRKKRVAKVAVTEGLMVIAVLAMVAITTLLAIGYNVDPKEGLVEKTGLVQIQSLPTGANVILDGNNVFGWTNLSQSMDEGEHEVTIVRDGYDSWSKKISVTAGLYYRLNYPRLFLTERKTEEIADFAEMRLVSYAKDGNLMLAVPNEGAIWKLFKINENKPTSTDIDMAVAFPDTAPEIYQGEIVVKGWSGNSSKVLLCASGQWLLLDVKHPEESVNLTEKFGIDFAEVKIANDAATDLFVVENGNLRTINVTDGKLSGVLVAKVRYMDNLKSDLVYVTEANEEGELVAGIYRAGEKGGTILSQMRQAPEDNVQVLVTIGEYFGEYYVMEVVNSQMGVYKGVRLPSFGDENELEAVAMEELGFVPEKLEMTGGGGLFTASSGNQRATLDVETMKLANWGTEGKSRWLDEHMLYGVEGEKLVVMDFDGENRREITDGAKAGTEVKISKNNRWMYFVGEDSKLKRVVIN